MFTHPKTLSQLNGNIGHLDAFKNSIKMVLLLINFFDTSCVTVLWVYCILNLIIFITQLFPVSIVECYTTIPLQT